MKEITYALTTFLATLPLFWGSAAIAQPAPPRLTPSQLQRLSSGLYRFNSEDFFRQGQRQLEREIWLLDRREQFLKEGILKISQDLQIEPDFSRYEQPELLQPGNSGEPD